MAVEFSGVVPELAVEVDRSVDEPLGHQVQEGLREAIRSRRLRPGERVPSTRQLAEQLGVSRGLVVAVYEQLLAEGYVLSTPGPGRMRRARGHGRRGRLQARAHVRPRRLGRARHRPDRAGGPGAAGARRRPTGRPAGVGRAGRRGGCPGRPAAAGGSRAVLLTPAHQCPTGAVLSPTRRRELVEWAREVDGVVLEDDYDAEFRYDRQPIGSLQGLAPDRVVALGPVSKTLAPALRIGWVFTPRRFRDAVMTELRLSCRGVPQVEQAALARLVETGRFDRHLRRVRDGYRRRRDALVAAVAEHVPGAGITGLDAGHHALLRLPEGVDEERLVEAANDAGIGVRGLGEYRVTSDDDAPRPPVPAALVIGFGNVTTRQIREGMAVLGELVASSG